jgi:hypothetical protein
MDQPTPQNSASTPEVPVADKSAQRGQFAELASSEEKPAEGAPKEAVPYHAPPHAPSEKKPEEEDSNELVGESIPANELGLKVLWPPAGSPDADKVDVE